MKHELSYSEQRQCAVTAALELPMQHSWVCARGRAVLIIAWMEIEDLGTAREGGSSLIRHAIAKHTSSNCAT